MAKVRTVVVYDRAMPRRTLYASHLRARLPLAIITADSAEQVGIAAHTADMVVLSFADGENPTDILLRLTTGSAPAVVVIESGAYTEAVYANVSLREHFVRREHRLASIFDSITNILKH